MKYAFLFSFLLLAGVAHAQQLGPQYFPHDPLAAAMYEDYFHDHDGKNKPMKAFYQQWKKKFPISIKETEYYSKKYYELQAAAGGHRYEYKRNSLAKIRYVQFTIESDEHIKVLGSKSVNSLLDLLGPKSESGQLDFIFWIEGDTPQKRTIYLRGWPKGNREGYMSHVFLRLECVDNKVTKIYNLPTRSEYFDDLKEKRAGITWSNKPSDWYYLTGTELAHQQELEKAVAALSEIKTPTPYESDQSIPLAKYSQYHIYEKGVVIKENVEDKQGVHLVHFGNFIYEGTLAKGLPSGQGRLLVLDQKTDEVWSTFERYQKIGQYKPIDLVEGLFFAGKVYSSEHCQVLKDGAYVVHSSLFGPLEHLEMGGFLKLAPGTDLTAFEFKVQEPITLYREKENFTSPRYQLKFTDATFRTAIGEYDNGGVFKMLDVRLEDGKWTTCIGRNTYKKEDGQRLLAITWRSPTPCPCQIDGAVIGDNIERISYDWKMGTPKTKRVGNFTRLQQKTWVMEGKVQNYEYDNDCWKLVENSTYAIAPRFGKESEEYLYLVDGKSVLNYAKSIQFHRKQLQLFKEQKEEAAIITQHENLFRNKYGYGSGNTYGEQVIASILYNGALRNYEREEHRGGTYCVIFTNRGKAKNIKMEVTNRDGHLIASEVIKLAAGVENKLFTPNLMQERLYYSFEYEEGEDGQSNFDDVYVLTGYQYKYYRSASADIARAAQREREQKAEAQARAQAQAPVKKRGWLQEEIDRSATFKVLVIENTGLSDCNVRYIATGGKAVYGGGISTTVPATGKVEVSFTAGTSNVKLDTSCTGVKAYWK